MPDNTQKPNPDDLNPAKNAGQDDIDRIIDKNFNPDKSGAARQDTQNALADQEESASSTGTDDDTELEERESQGVDWQNNTTQEDPIDRKSRISSFFRGKKNKGIIAFIIACATIMGFMFSLLSGALGLVNLKETVIGKLTQRADNVMTHRMNRVMVKKMSQDLTSGCTIKVKCRYKGMSTLEVRKFNKRNIGNGVRVVTEPSIIPGRQKVVAIETYQPSSEVVVGKDGSVNGKTVKSYRAGEIRTAMRDVPQVRKAAITFYKPYVQYYSGNVARGMLKRVGVDLSKKKVSEGKGTTEAEKFNSQQNDLIDRAQGSGQQNTGSAAGSSGNDLPDEVNEEIENRTETLSEQASDPSQRPYTPSPGDPGYDPAFGNAGEAVEKQGSGLSGFIKPLGFMLNYCTLRSIGKAANQVRKIDQTVQLIKYSALFFTLADQIKSGNADGDTAETINVTMSMLTATDADGLSAFDSAGYNWIERGAVRPSDGEDMTKFQNGGQAYGLLGGVVSATTSGFGPVCSIANSPTVTVAAIAATVLSGGTAGAFGKIFQQGGKDVAKNFIKNSVEEGVGNILKRKFADSIKDKTKKQLAYKAINNRVTKLGAVSALFYFGTGPIIEVLARSDSKTVAKGLVGLDSGNAFVSGSGGLVSKASQAQALEPITASEAVEQDKGATQSSALGAKLEGVNHFDASNQYSFSNKLASVLIPTISKVDSVSSIGAGFAGIYSTAFGGFAQKAYAEDDPKKQYQFCKDEEYQSAGLDVATDPFCNPQYGFDMKIVRGSAYEPEKVVDYVYDNGFVDAEGEPIGEFSDFVANCLESDTSIGQDEEGNVRDECVSREDKYRMMRMYCTDSSIDSDMKEEITGNCSTQDNIPSSDSAGNDSTQVSGDAQSLAAQLLDSDKVDITNYCRYCREDLENTADGKPAYGNVTIDINMLKFLVDLSNNMDVNINSITGAGSGHSSGSNHYKGKGVDFECSMTDAKKMDEIAEKYGIKTNFERCDQGVNHWHYSIGGS